LAICTKGRRVVSNATNFAADHPAVLPGTLGRLRGGQSNPASANVHPYRQLYRRAMPELLALTRGPLAPAATKPTPAWASWTGKPHLAS